MSKHEDIINYIKGLKTGTKISVRSIASELKVSEGTAYRAIKFAENIGVVNTIPRVGTIKVDKREKKNIDRLTYKEISNIVDGRVLGGAAGLSKTLNKFIIGAMQLDEMLKYVSQDNLVIVGNREEIQKAALESGSAVLITGGFPCTEGVKGLADMYELPVISCSYDTFTTATMINKAISENLIKKEIILVDEVMKKDIILMKTGDTIEKLRELYTLTGHEKYPVVDPNNYFTGVISYYSVPQEAKGTEGIGKYIMRDVEAVDVRTSVAYVAHLMVWEGGELVPVTEDKKLVGLLSRQDIIKALQQAGKQPHISETIEDLALKSFSFYKSEDGMKFSGCIVPEMMNPLGTASWNTLSLLMSSAGMTTLRHRNNLNISVDSFSVYYMKSVQIDADVEIATRVFETGRNHSKVEIEMKLEDTSELIGKALLSVRVFRK